jgi:hypothetical protein
VKKEHRKRFKKEEDMFLKGETKMNRDGEEGFVSVAPDALERIVRYGV